MNYLEIKIAVEGISPLLMNNPQSMTMTGNGLNSKKIPSPEDEASAKVYILPNRQLYVPAIAFRSAIIDAVTGRRIGKATARRVSGAALFVLEEFCPLVDPENGKPIKKYSIDIRRAVVQGNGVMRARPRIDRWATTMVFEYDPDFLSKENIFEAVELAGKIVGVMDYRPRPPKGKGGPFGRFKLK